jgi:predicted HTH domain antitoxin
MHLAAISELVRTYKNKILNEKLSGIEKLNSLRLSILNIALITEDSIGFARTAYTKLRDAFME